MFQFQDMFEIGKPNIVLKTVKSFNIKRASIKMLVLVFIINFYSDKRWDPNKPNLCPFLTLSVRYGPSVSFGTNVP